MTCEINSTVITENKKAIQTIYKMLWDIIALYEPTDAYNSLPNSDDNTDCRDYMDAQILKGKNLAVFLSTINTLFKC